MYIKPTMKNTKIILLIVFVLIVVIAILRFSSQEDIWLCDEGIWVQHGHPSAAKPTTACGEF
jgi:hypothetical protein